MGIYDIDYKMAIACRDGKIYIIKSHNVRAPFISADG